MFTRRFTWSLDDNALTRAAAARRAAGLPLLDLTLSNPTRAGFAWSAETLAAAFAAAENRFYAPDPRGLLVAREAVAAYYAGHGAAVSPEQIHLCASTSEACAWLLKLLTDPGDTVLVPAPAYPLLQFLAEMECVKIAPYPLVLRDGRWRVDAAALDAAVTPRTRAIFCVAPNNPAGAVPDVADRDALRETALRHGLAIIADEVFLDFAAETADAAAAAAAAAAVLPTWAGETAVPLFALSGLSKVALLPQAKLAWIVTAGPAQWRGAALERLDFVADTYLSASAGAQNAAGALLAAAPAARAAALRRIAANERALRDWCAASTHGPALLPREAGWMALIALPKGTDEEASALYLAKRAGVLVHPGFFYDMPPDAGAFWVVSLLAHEADFTAAFPAFEAALLRH